MNSVHLGYWISNFWMKSSMFCTKWSKMATRNQSGHLLCDQFCFIRWYRFVFHYSNQLTEDQSGMLLMSLTLPCGTNSVSRQTFYERWVQCFLLIQQKEVGLYELSVLPSNSRDNSSMSNVIYRVTDQTFVVQEIQYSSQSDSGSPIQWDVLRGMWQFLMWVHSWGSKSQAICGMAKEEVISFFFQGLEAVWWGVALMTELLG